MTEPLLKKDEKLLLSIDESNIQMTLLIMNEIKQPRDKGIYGMFGKLRPQIFLAILVLGILAYVGATNDYPEQEGRLMVNVEDLNVEDLNDCSCLEGNACTCEDACTCLGCGCDECEGGSVGCGCGGNCGCGADETDDNKLNELGGG